MTTSSFDPQDAQRGQALAETILVVPIFLTSLAAMMALVTAYGWRESSYATAVHVRLAVASQAKTSELTRKQGYSLRQLHDSKAQPGAHNAHHLKLWLDTPSEKLIAKPHAQQPLAPYSPVLRQIMKHGQPTMTAPVRVVFDNWSGLPIQGRSAWHNRVHRHMQWNHHQRRFVATVASGGRERHLGPFNLSRDCLYSAQGLQCLGTTSRRDGLIQEHFRSQRRVTYAVQTGLCVAEACRNAPHPLACGALATTAVAQASSNQEPTVCSVTVAWAKGLHQGGAAALRVLQTRETINYSRRVAGLTTVDSLGPMY
jgi:hypothetical protein